MRRDSFKVTSLLLALLFFLVPHSEQLRAQGRPIGFDETYALAEDRAKALEKLIPGTSEYYYYSCLHKQDLRDFAAVTPLLAAWVKRHGRTARVMEIENRQALLSFAKNQRATYDFLKQRLHLSFTHQRKLPGQKPDLPTRLDQELISTAALDRRARRLHPRTVNGYQPSAYRGLAASNLDANRFMSLMSKLQGPDLPGLPALVLRQLADRRSRGFGSLPIHSRMFLAQLDVCARQKPELLQVTAFVNSYLLRLKPGEEEALRWDAEVREAYLDRLQAFVQRLSSTFNSLKVHVLHHRLVHDLALGKPDRARFMAYLRLPRHASYYSPQRLRRRDTAIANLNKSYLTGFDPVGNDEKLVRRYLMQFFRGMDSFEPFAENLEASYLRRLFAETKILAGLGDKERWYSLLDSPAYYESLEKRVDIEFLPTQKRWYSQDEAVALDVEVKNVTKLIVKVFEIDSFNFLRGEGREVDAAINLDGLVANVEKTYTYTEPALLRVRRHFDLPTLDKAGAYVVELIGNGMSSRAVIHKGRLQFIEHPGAAGHVFRIFDERSRPRPAATIWFGKREYRADEDGEIVLPYSTKPGNKRIILRDGKLASLGSFWHLAENYELLAAVHVDREALSSGKKAEIFVRPTLLLNGRRVSLAVLQKPVLTITAVDQRGISTSQDISGKKFSMGKEFVYEIQVPSELRRLSVSLRAQVRSLSLDKDLDLRSGSKSFDLSSIQATAQTWSPLLGRSAQGYHLDVLGKDGEPKADLAMQLSLRHRDYKDPLSVFLKTDAKGRISLGQLAGITQVTCNVGLPRKANTWSLITEQRSYPRRLHGVAGETLSLPYVGKLRQLSRSLASCFELRGGQIAFDAFDRLALVSGFLELRDLRPGKYQLHLKEADVRIDVEITKGSRQGPLVLGTNRILELQDPRPLQIISVRLGEKSLRIQLANAKLSTRVHVFANRYQAAYDPFLDLVAPARYSPLSVKLDQPRSSYHSGREIGDEYRYILDRRFAKKYPGNMLHRPGLLLNPWALEATRTAIAVGGGAGGRFGGRRGGGSRRGHRGPGDTVPSGTRSPSTFPDLGFLPTGARVLANLRPDREGLIEIPLADLGDGQILHVLAVDAYDTVYKSFARSELPLQPKSQVLSHAFDAKKQLMERRRVQFLGKDESVTIEGASLDLVASLDSLAAVFQLYRSLSHDRDLASFAFILDWPGLPAAKKQALYSKHACHELHFFLYEKDRPFFDKVIAPYLRNKAHKSFLDRWLLSEDLSRYLESRAFAQLNVVERILLSHRIAGQAKSIERHVRESYELLPVDPEKQRRLFLAALRSQDLDAGNALGKELGKLAAKRKDGRAPRRAYRSEEKSRKRRSGRRAPAKKGKSVGRPAAPGADKAARAADLEEPELEEPKDEVMGRGVDFDAKRDLSRRAQQKRLYRAPELTRRYVEHNYWHRRIHEQGAGMIPANAFWRDYAATPKARPFFSENLAYASGSFAEMMFALSVLDLPFTPGEHAIKVDGTRLTLKAASPLLLVRKDIVETKAAAKDRQILVNQNYYRLDERYRFVGNVRRDAYISDEFLIDVAYGCQIVITNPSSSPRRLDLLLQIPQGAIPVQRGFYTRGSSLELGAYATSSITYAFYFPHPLKAPHYPVQVSADGRLLAFAAARSLAVLAEPSRVDTLSWEHVSQNGTSDDVFQYLDKANMNRVDLSKILWRLRDRAFFDALIAKLRGRHHYDAATWSYGFHHREATVAREYLESASSFVARCGKSLVSELLTIDPIERLSYQHVEYEPLFNPRAHKFGKSRVILNADLAQQYQSLLAILRYRPKMDSVDWMSVTYYLLLQDRVEEAISAFAKVEVNRLPMRLQYDYMRAYLDFFTDDHALARQIAQKYLKHPVERWRVRFQQIVDHLDEAQGRAVAGRDPDNREDRQTVLASQEASLTLAVEARRVSIEYRKVKSVEVNYYDMDVESLFSAHPFVQGASGSFAYVRPNFREQRNCPADKSKLSFDLPEMFRNANVLVEVRAAGLTKRQPYYANSLTVHLAENYGQLTVTQSRSGKPLARVYVKVFARMPSGGKPRFHKDGYTDLRGRFDYASLSGAGANNAVRYAILVLSEQHGAVIRETAPPPR